ncbi:APC family permease [Methanohalophilus portucalensis]|uniref:Amino acid permease n=2 Tax=Methanohalophilus portucalensis TaxID=39664 RepID=A0A1L9C2P7_9EURY|nr:amino acid permease [Methanohalophilus portucalensis]ATU08012.1 amino acid permease [Methanohalophilus portucalensis]OJH48795.1 amino acid permease-associated region [Methanohalophilus portucalensis FDF-1]RNI12266.1 amino acid permease [Methanohalophilus portucalensis FDF-1]SMH42991.1 monomethylamine permease, EAT family [Methanohalophilus portucalensis FDF-1]
MTDETTKDPLEESTGLVKTLRPYHVWALGVGIVLVGEYMGWNFTVAKGGILGSLLALLVAGTMYLMVSLCASELGASTKLAGGPYDWARLFVGPGAAALVGLAVYMEYIALEAADAIVVASIAESIFPEIQVFPVTLLVITFLTFMNYRGVVAALNLNFALTFTAFIAILVFFAMSVTGFAGVWNPGNLISGAIPNGFIGIFAALQFGPWFYLGIEGAAMSAEECKHPSRAVPLGQQAGMITLLLAAGMTLYVCSGLIPTDQLGVSVYPLYEAATNSGVQLLVVLLAIGTLFTCLASANGTICDSSRSWYALSRDQFLTPWFSAVHPKYNTPYRAVIFTMPIAIAFAFSGFLDQVITFSITSGLVCYVMIPFSLIRFRKMFPQHSNKVRPFVGPLQPWLAYFTIFLALVIMSTLQWGYRYNLIFGLLFYAIAYFYFNRRYRSLEVSHDWGEEMGWPDPVRT